MLAFLRVLLIPLLQVFEEEEKIAVNFLATLHATISLQLSFCFVNHIKCSVCALRSVMIF